MNQPIDQDLQQRLDALDLMEMRELCAGPDLFMARAVSWFCCTIVGGLLLVAGARVWALAPESWGVLRGGAALAAVAAAAYCFWLAWNSVRLGHEPRPLLALFGYPALREHEQRLLELRRRIREMEGESGFVWHFEPMLDRREEGPEARLLHVMRISKERPGEILEWVQPLEYLELLERVRARSGSRWAPGVTVEA